MLLISVTLHQVLHLTQKSHSVMWVALDVEREIEIVSHNFLSQLALL